MRKFADKEQTDRHRTFQKLKSTLFLSGSSPDTRGSWPIIHQEVDSALDGKRKELAELESQKLSKKELQARTETIHTDIEDLLAIQNLESLLASHNPHTREGYFKLIKRQIKINPGPGQNEKLILFRKNALQTLRDILQGYKGGEDLLCPGLHDVVLALFI